MRNYTPLLVGLAFASMHAMEEGAPVQARIRYYEPNVSTMNPSGYVTVIITPNTSLYEIQEAIRRAVGPGDLQMGSIRLDSYGVNDPFVALPLLNRYDSPRATKNALERFYIFWKY
jgi:hypothetical protein